MGATICIKCGSSIESFSYCELCKEPLNFKCSSCGFVTEVKVHVDCVNANSLVTGDESGDKGDSHGISAKPQDPIQSDGRLSNISSTQNVKVIDREISNEKNIFRSERSDIIEKSWYSLARLSADIFALSNRLSSFYYEQYLQYEKAWGYYWTETFKSFNTYYQNDGSHKWDII